MVARILVLLLGLLVTGAQAQPAYRRIPGAELRSVLPPDSASATARVAAFELRERSEEHTSELQSR